MACFLGIRKIAFGVSISFALNRRCSKAHWVMVVMDQYSRRIIGFAVEKGAVSAEGVCQMFNQIAFWSNVAEISFD